MPRTMSTEKEARIRRYAGSGTLGAEYERNLVAELDAERAVSAELAEAVKESNIRLKDLFDRHERPTYRDERGADSDLALLLATNEAALAQYAAS